MLEVFRDDSETTRTRMEAATWLADRGFGKPTQTTALELSEPSELEELEEVEPLTLEDLRRAMCPERVSAETHENGTRAVPASSQVIEGQKGCGAAG